MTPFVLFGAVLLVGLVVTYWFSDDARTRRLLKEAPARKIREIQEGMVVRVTGRLRPAADLVQAPLSGRHCAYYEVLVEERRSTGKSSRWYDVLREVKARDFEVEDGTGVVLVRMGACKVAITKDTHTRSGTFDNASAAERALLERNGEESTGLLGFNRTLRYEEGALEPGEEVTVLGQVKVHTGLDGARVLAIGPPPDRPVLVSDDRGTVRAR
jgi:hypothetical protein